jgi:hypothetical protein
MARYLIVAYQTADSPELIEFVRAKTVEDPGAEFVLLVPATPGGFLRHRQEGDARQLAANRGAEAAVRLAEAGVAVVVTKVGSHSPLEAVGNELIAQPNYHGIILSTFPPRISRWLRADLPNQLRRRYGLPVDHVVAPPAA